MSKEFAILSDLEHIRQRAGMYIGSTERPDHLLTEVLDNSIDEALNGYADKISISIKDGSCTISDNGRGIPVEEYVFEGEPRSIVYWVFSKLFSGTKFGNSYKMKIGLNGVGLCAVNALSESVLVHSRPSSGGNLRLAFKDGNQVKKEIHILRETTGTSVTFTPNKKYFDSVEFSLDKVIRKLRLVKLYHPTIDINFNGNSIDTSSPFEFFSSQLNNLAIKSMLSIDTENVKAFLNYDLSSNQEDIVGSVNLIPTTGGSHYGSFRESIQNAFSSMKGGYNFNLEDSCVGLRGLFIFYTSDTSFSSQTKDEFSIRITKVRPFFMEFEKQLSKFLAENYKKITEPLLKKFQAYRDSLKNLSTMDFLKSTIKFGEVSGGTVSRNKVVKKLMDCSSRDVEECELIIVEGNSACGSVLQVRNPKYHALLPLRGKCLNAVNADLVAILKNAEFNSLINSLGSGIHPREDIEKLRYGKIILLADADPDGLQINALLLGALCKLCPKLVESGKVYLGDMPLYKQGGTYIWDESQLNKRLAFVRYKGLGEMNSDELKVTALDKATRHIRKIVVSSVDDLLNTTKIVGDSGYRKEYLIREGVL